MNGRKYLLGSINVLNVLLLAAVVLAAIPSPRQEVRCELPVPKTAAVLPAAEAVPRRSPSSIDYAAISDSNLFHPERRIPPEKKEEKATGRPDVNLYGTLTAGDLSIAFLEDKKAPVSTAGRGRRQIALRKGGTLNGYVLRDVLTDRIVLVKGDEQLLVMLTEGDKRKTEVASAGTSAGQAAGGAGSAGAPQPSKVPPPPTRPAAAPGAAGGTPESRPAAGMPGATAVPATPSGQPAAVVGPGIGASGSWPPTQSSIEQTRQKIKEGQRLRLEQLQKQ
ncbi:MAG: hypothetical protein A4E73_01786 [Syntrophaceae bacterium PtaU1.Bin231]|nr:MAG: hypothetical protein A4E73_01786 [Syntrophaceae bacterium PtaU1.Bin231]HOG17140.1 hypothetical protein [Syntrophales bacterium]